MGVTGSAAAPGGWRRLLAEPARPASVAQRSSAPWFAVGTVCIGAFMGQLDASIVTVAFPTMSNAFHQSLGAVEWVGLGYLLVLISMVTAVGRLADMVGRKLLYIYGFVLFIVGSALCGLAPTLPVLDAFRVLQGFGAAMLQANSVAIIVQAMPEDKIGKGIGVQGAAQALGLALGPAVGGLLIQVGGWPLIFYVNVPAGIIGTILGWYLIPRSRHLQARARFDWTGLALFVPAICAFLLAITGVQLRWDLYLIIGLFVVAAALLALFVRAERSNSSPMVDLTLFKRVPFTAGIASGLLSYLVLFGAMFVIPVFLERAQGLGPAATGAYLLAMPAALGIVAPFAGGLADKVGARPLTVGGMVLSAAALGVMSFFHGSIGIILIELVVLGAGLGAFTPPNNAAIMGAAPRAQSGVASGMLNMTRGMGTSMGLALTDLVFALVAGLHARAVGPITNGFSAAVLFLAVMAVLAMVLAAMRGNTELNLDPTLTAE
ncbi:MAG: MFS transporter [Acidimicrobiales bacterium]